jgi:5-methylcytosine-specific restriction endonuclease McrA
MLDGKPTYFTGKPCKYGHIAERRTAKAECIACEADRNNSESRKEYMASYAEKQREKLQEIATRWQKNNKGKVNANTAFNHSAKMLRTPKWLSPFEKLHIKCLYQVAAMRSKHSEIAWDVDHIVPLKGKTVSGLHVPWNLRVIPKKENILKGNKYHV